MPPIYLDYNATTPIDRRVAEAMIPYLYEHFGNPSSAHAFGATALRAVVRARGRVAALLGCAADEVVFTSGGSEANNTAIKGAALARRTEGDHIVTSQIEHPAVTEVCRWLERQGFRVTYVTVDRYGRVAPEDVERALVDGTILVTIMHANNEVGTIQPIRAIADLAHSRGAWMHTDAAQSVGKIPVRVADLGVDLLSVAGHKLYAPKGIGALYVRAGLHLEKQIHGADHEMNWRAGTENVLEIVGLGEACALAAAELDRDGQHLRRLRDRLESRLRERHPDMRVNGHPEERLPNTASVSFPQLEANTILAALDEVAASAGAACHADGVDVSAVLQAMRVPTEVAMGTLRLSVGRPTTAAEIDRAATEISRVVEELRPAAPDSSSPGDSDSGPVTVSDAKLTRFTHGLGCACKLRPQVLEEVLRRLPRAQDPALLVGTEHADDAAVYRLDEKTALVQTVDFFTPIVDDPYDFGAIAAANSLSDIYAMGARPLVALNIVAFPSQRLAVSVLEAILRGARDKAAEAGIAIAGGHTIDDPEPKFGLAVTGIAAPDRLLTNATAQAGDALVLTKPLGTGIQATAGKQGALDQDRTAALVAVMASLNRAASEAAVAAKAHACTDVTGFGLLGHLMEMMLASGTTAHLQADAVPVLPGTLELAASGIVPGGSRDNLAHVAPRTRWARELSEPRRLVLADAQTSGGLLIALPAARASELVARLRDSVDTDVAVIGEIVAREDVAIVVV